MLGIVVANKIRENEKKEEEKLENAADALGASPGFGVAIGDLKAKENALRDKLEAIEASKGSENFFEEVMKQADQINDLVKAVHDAQDVAADEFFKSHTVIPVDLSGGGGTAASVVETASVEPSPSSSVVIEEPISITDTVSEQIIYYDDVKVGEQRNIITVKIPPEMENNVDMGHEKMNVLMSGDGATPSTACLVTGVPGAGKSTMMFQLADAITGAGHIALYNTCEESLVQVARVAKRLRLKHGFNVASHRSVFDLTDHARDFQKKNPGKQVFLFVDSLQTIEVPNYEYDDQGLLVLDKDGNPQKRKGRPLGGQTVQVESTKILTAWCKRTYGIMFLIGQVNKDGDFAGRQAIKHWVDAHLHLDINRDRYSGDYGCRTAEMTKNRFGIAGVYYPFEIEARGIKFTEPKEKK